MSLPDETLDLWIWRSQRYLLRAVTVEAYRRHMKIRSPKWGTVCLAGSVFRELARPFRFFTHEYGTHEFGTVAEDSFQAELDFVPR